MTYNVFLALPAWQLDTAWMTYNVFLALPAWQLDTAWVTYNVFLALLNSIPWIIHCKLSLNTTHITNNRNLYDTTTSKSGSESVMQHRAIHLQPSIIRHLSLSCVLLLSHFVAGNKVHGWIFKFHSAFMIYCVHALFIACTCILFSRI
jgi:uncharacterized membrane protein